MNSKYGFPTMHYDFAVEIDGSPIDHLRAQWILAQPNGNGQRIQDRALLEREQRLAIGIRNLNNENQEIREQLRAINQENLRLTEQSQNLQEQYNALQAQEQPVRDQLDQ